MGPSESTDQNNGRESALNLYVAVSTTKLLRQAEGGNKRQVDRFERCNVEGYRIETTLMIRPYITSED